MKLNYFGKLIFVIFVLMNYQADAQCGLYEINLAEKVKESSVIIEGQVSQQRCYKDDLKKKIYTINTIKVFGVFKGHVPQTIYIVTAGGQLNNEMEIASSLLTLQVGQFGMFFLNQLSGQTNQLENVYQVYSSSQGFYHYNFNEQKVNEVFQEYSNINNAFYTMLEADHGLVKISTYTELNWGGEMGYNRLTVINNFSPEIIHGGASEQIVINGIGFGNVRDSSKVLFKNADNGGTSEIAAEAAHYISWSDTKIVVLVPSKAGTGRIAVMVGNLRDQSSQSLKVNYAFINTGSNALLHIPKHVARNANKGYIWNINSTFEADSIALANFLVSFKKWRCKTFINWSIGKDTEIDFSARDTISVISFDERDELPAGVLGLCYAYYSGCTQDDWYIEEQDMLFRRSDKWYFGEGAIPSNKVDFQSVALHELGHAHQLAHVIDNLDLMHYSIAPGVTKRNIEPLNLEAAQRMISTSTESGVCDKNIMQLLDSDLCNDELFGYYNYIIYPNPFNDFLKLELYLTKEDKLKVQLVDLTGKLIGIYQNSKVSKGLFSLKFDTPDRLISAGVYLMIIEFGEEKTVKKLMKIAN